MKFAQLFVLFPFLASMLHVVFGHVGLVFPDPREILSNTLDKEDILTSIVSSYSDGPLPFSHREGKYEKPFPCGSNKPTKKIEELKVGTSLLTKYLVRVDHSGGNCQWAVSYDNAKTFVVFHEYLDTCFQGVRKKGMNTEISVPIPETLINGDVVISWSYIPSQEQQMYGDCFDAKITGSTSREFVGKPMVVANFGSLIDNLRVYAKGRGADHLWKNASPLILKLNSQNQMTLSPSEFSPTRIFKKNDPLLKYFQEPINPNNLNKNPSPVILNSQQIKSNTGEVSNTATYNNPHPAKPTVIQKPIETTTQTTEIQNNPLFPRTGRSLSQNEAQNVPQTDKKPLSQPALEQIPSSITSRSTAADVPATNDPPINSAIGSTEGISPALTPALNTGGCQCPYSCSSHT